MKNLLLTLVLFLIQTQVWSQANWQRDFEVHTPRENIYNLDSANFVKVVMEGRRHALFYPVGATELLIPYQPLKNFFESDANDPVRRLLYQLAKVVSPFKSMHEVYGYLGLQDYPNSYQKENPNPIPELSQREKELPMGATIIETVHGEALTFGCAACHTGNLFGVKVLGLTNRFPRANAFFDQGKKLAPYVNTFLFQDLLKSTDGERIMLKNSKESIKFVGTKEPVVLGLDTSLAQVALSLARREQDEYATKKSRLFPRSNPLEKKVADSKPAVWWNLKYKNRWLSDGSIVSGNPVHTNFLWNEIGRGIDLKNLEGWLKNNHAKIEALTAAVFASKAPKYVEFFGEKSIDISKAQRGEKHFVQSCQKCHGVYEKNWSTNSETVKVTYHKKTPVIDVGTDPGRYQGMNAFAGDLNRLKISRSIGTVVEPQKGYVPPPLVGIWSRWPYFHNNSVPNLCALLTKSSERPKTYWSHEAQDKNRDFDQDCVGYPVAEKIPSDWKNDKDFFYDTRKEGLSNSGHDERIFLQDGKEIYTAEQKSELIEFLKTL